jgi:hypothetical protein
LILFGKYVGTAKSSGFVWVNPFYTKRKVSLRANNLDTKPIKVNDKQGNPIILFITSKGYQAGPENAPYTWNTARFTGNEWEILPVTTSDNNYDMGSLMVDKKGNWTIVGPTTTGNDTTWKIVSGDVGSTYTLGSPFKVDSVTSQTGVKVFQFPLKQTDRLLGRLVFQSGDYYVLIAFPYAHRPDHGTLSQSDIAAYNTILSNIAKTVRTPPIVTTN